MEEVKRDLLNGIESVWDSGEILNIRDVMGKLLQHPAESVATYSAVVLFKLAGSPGSHALVIN